MSDGDSHAAQLCVIALELADDGEIRRELRSVLQRMVGAALLEENDISPVVPRGE